MLPAQFEPTGSYSPRVFDRTRGYRLLAHAEIEACLEDLVTSLINDAYSEWLLDRQPRQSLFALLAYHEGTLGPVPDAISSTGSSARPLRARVKDARDAYVTRVRRNNGIRERDVLRLLLPVGVLESELDSAWLQEIDAFGEARGDAAHQALRTQQPPDPATEYEVVCDVVAGLRKIDARLTALA
jgi:hypothetical protein